MFIQAHDIAVISYIMYTAEQTCTLDDNALEKLVDDHKNKNTKCKTKSGLRICVGEKSTLGEQSQQELVLSSGAFLLKCSQEGW